MMTADVRTTIADDIHSSLDSLPVCRSAVKEVNAANKSPQEVMKNSKIQNEKDDLSIINLND